MSHYELLLGDCLEKLKELPDCSVDAVVTDPPYDLTGASGSGGFMGKKWDATGIAFRPDVWLECLRVLKPGGHLLAFGGTRTYHRMACAIEDAGFEVRDSIHWMYGSGFPKSLSVGKAIDKALGSEGTFGEPKSAAHAGWIARGRMRGEEGHEGYQRPWMQDAEAVDKNARQYIPATDAARHWEGWGTALKPSHEPIVVARKPLIGTVAQNVLDNGTGAINVDGCRVRYRSDADMEQARVPMSAFNSPTGKTYGFKTGTGRTEDIFDPSKGRWPPNVIFSHLPECLETECAEGCAVRQLDEQSGASRFFPAFRYQAKAPAKERKVGGISAQHPTQKPVELMRWLVRLVTPPGGVVLDPFTGSGTTGVAAILEGFRFIGCEREGEYFALAKARLDNAVASQGSKQEKQPMLFDLEGMRHE